MTEVTEKVPQSKARSRKDGAAIPLDEHDKKLMNVMQSEFPLIAEPYPLIAERAGLTKRDAGAAVDAFLDVVTATLKKGDQVTFTGFGKFSVSQRAQREGVNPRTKEPVTIPAATVPKFSAGSQLKKAVN